MESKRTTGKENWKILHVQNMELIWPANSDGALQNILMCSQTITMKKLKDILTLQNVWRKQVKCEKFLVKATKAKTDILMCCVFQKYLHESTLLWRNIVGINTKSTERCSFCVFSEAMFQLVFTYDSSYARQDYSFFFKCSKCNIFFMPYHTNLTSYHPAPDIWGHFTLLTSQKSWVVLFTCVTRYMSTRKEILF